MAKNKIIKGRDLMLFDENGHSYAFAQNHSISLSAEQGDISSKDHGLWGAAEVTKISWEISTENLYTEDNFDKMFDALTTASPIKVRFGLKSETDNAKTVADGDYDYWTSTDTYYEGTVVITSLQANANNGENATYSATLTGSGKISKVTSGTTKSTKATTSA